jgi:16S rRNA (cytidine1402-2'-O)-methyltransferase
MLEELADIFPEHRLVLAREITKKFEEFIRGNPKDLLTQMQQRSIKGEFVVMVSPTTV